MDSIKRFTDKVQKFYELVESHECQIQNWIKESKKPLNSLTNQSAIFRAIAPVDSVRSTPFEHIEGFRENLLEIIQASLEEEFEYLNEIRCKINIANENLHREQTFLENLFFNLRNKGVINTIYLNPCCPSLEHIIGWSHDIWCYYHSFYLQVSQALISIKYEDEKTVKNLIEAFKENSELKRELNKIRSFSFSKFEFMI